jgi:hypothetical protein
MRQQEMGVARNTPSTEPGLCALALAINTLTVHSSFKSAPAGVYELHLKSILCYIDPGYGLYTRQIRGPLSPM